VGNDDANGPTEIDDAGFMTFGLGAIPDGATVTAATLYIRVGAQNLTAMSWPFSIDHVDYSNVYDTTSDLANRKSIAAPRNIIQGGYYQFSASPGVGGWVQAPSAAQVQYALTNLKSYQEGGSFKVFQIRISDSTPASRGNPNTMGYLDFSAQNDATAGNRPFLRVYYTAPGKEMRGFTGFDLAKVSNGNITAATMYVYRQTAVGTAGNVLVDHVDYGPTLGAYDFNTTVYGLAVASVPTASGSWAGMNMKSAVSNAWTNKKIWTKNGSQRWFETRFRLSSIDTNDQQADQQTMGSVEAGNGPYLRVYYQKSTIGGPVSIVSNTAVLGTNFALATVSVQNGGTTIAAKKEVTNVTLKGNASAPIPGATLSFRITASNKTMVNGVNVIVIDRVMTNTAFVTNSANNPGWTLEYSTNISPNQAYVSANYTAVQPPPSKVKWIRWKRASWTGMLKDVFRYRVIVR